MRIKDDICNQIIINKSKFITYLHKCYSEEQALEFINHIRKLHPEATHVCTAFRVKQNQIQRSSDNNEPSGTAGIPMLQTLISQDMEEICACVVRYYGGIKLGAGGLIRAYRQSVSLALDQAEKLEVKTMNIYEVTFSYDYIDRLNYLLDDYIMEKNYDLQVTYQFMIEDLSILKTIEQLTKGKYVPKFLEQKNVEVACSVL